MNPPRPVDLARFGLGVVALARLGAFSRLSGGTAARGRWIPEADAIVDLGGGSR